MVHTFEERTPEPPLYKPKKPTPAPQEELERVLMGRVVKTARWERNGDTFRDEFIIVRVIAWADGTVTLYGEEDGGVIPDGSLDRFLAGEPVVHRVEYTGTEWSLQLKEAPGKEKTEGEPGSEPWLACEENPEVAKAIAAFAENLPDRLFTKREVAAVMAYIVGVAMEQTLKLAGQPKARPTKTED